MTEHTASSFASDLEDFSQMTHSVKDQTHRSRRTAWSAPAPAVNRLAREAIETDTDMHALQHRVMNIAEPSYDVIVAKALRAEHLGASAIRTLLFV